MAEKQIGRPINVSLRVIADLSQGLYRSPADALKELISNAYDADSPTVEIIFSSDFETLTVKDKGKGMKIEQFIQIMETIGGSSKRSIDTANQDTTPSGRKIVGRIGIGLLSVSQIANKLEIHSTTSGSSEGFKASIEFDQFASEQARKIRITELWEEEKPIKLGNYFYSPMKAGKNESFTTLVLSGLKKVIVEKLRGNQEVDGYPRMMGISFNTTRQLVDWMRENSITKTALHEYDRLFWELCTLCPVPYYMNTLKIRNSIAGKTSKEKQFLSFITAVNEETHLKLTFDGLECNRPILMPHKLDQEYDLFFNLLFMDGLDQREIAYSDYDDNGNLVNKSLRVRGYIYFQRPKIWPPELQGILIRVRNVAVGHYDPSFLTYRRHEGFKFSQITGEIYVDNLDDALNIDRSSFRETEPSFIAFREAIHNYLNKKVFPGIKEFASTEREERLEDRILNEVVKLKRNFEEIDEQNRTILIGGNQQKVIERYGNVLSIASSIKGKKLKLNKDAIRIIAFVEAKFSKKYSVHQMDALYEDLTNWLIEFDHG